MKSTKRNFKARQNHFSKDTLELIACVVNTTHKTPKTAVPLTAAPILLKAETKFRFVDVLLDTGATINAVEPSVLAELEHYFLSSTMQTVVGVGGTLKASKWYIIKLKLEGGQEVKIPVLGIDNLVYPIILGLPFIEQVQLSLDYHNRFIETKIGLFTWHPPAKSSNSRKEEPITYYIILNIHLSAIHNEELQQALRDTTLSDENIEKVRSLLIHHRKVWTQSGVGQAGGVEHEIILTSKIPVVLPPRQIALKHQPALDVEIERMLADGVISPSASPYAAYPVLVPKPDGSLRVAIDYRRLNEITITDSMPLPRINDLIQSVEGSVYFALFDLRQGFWQIPLALRSRPCTAFRTHRSLYEFNVMPFGLKNAPGTFQRWTDDMFRDLRYTGVLVYIDDLLVHAATQEEFLDLLEVVFGRLAFYRAQVKMSKSLIAPKIVKYLGHYIEGGKRRSDPQKAERLKHIQQPTNVKGIQRILGSFGYYRDYLRDFATRTEPLTRLLRKNQPFCWTPAHQQIIVDLACELANATLHVAPSGRRFRIETDASDVALGGVLYDADLYDKSAGKVLPIKFLAKKLSPTESNWSAAEREAYAIVWALEDSDAFVRGREVLVVTDHKNLQWIMNAKKGKLARWCSRLSEYNVKVVYRSGPNNVVADFLSRCIEFDPLSKDTMYCYCLMSTPVNVNSMQNRFNSSAKPWHCDIQLVSVTAPLSASETPQAEPEVYIELPDETIEESVELNYYPFTLEKVYQQQLIELPKRLGREFYIQGGKVYYLAGLWVPPSLRIQLLDTHHLTPPYFHLGVKKTLTLLKRFFNWEGMQEAVQLYIRKCVYCQRTKLPLRELALKERSHAATNAFQCVYLDFWGPIRWGVKEEIVLTMIDWGTRWVEVVSLPNKSAEAVTQAFFHCWISRFGAPLKVVHDNEATLISGELRKFMASFGIKDVRTTVYHPQGNAPIETFHRWLKKMLTQIRLSHGRDMDLNQALQWVAFSYRAVPHETISHSPAYLAHGTDITISPFVDQLLPRGDIGCDNRLQMLGEIRQDILRKQQALQQVALEQSRDQKHLRKTFEIGQIVLVRLTPKEKTKLMVNLGSKLNVEWSQPCRVQLVLGEGYAAQVKCLATGMLIKVYIDRVKFVEVPTEGSLKEIWEKECVPKIKAKTILKEKEDFTRKRPRIA